VDEPFVWNKDVPAGSDPNQPITLAVILPFLPNLRHFSSLPFITKASAFAASLALTNSSIHLTSLSGIKFTTSNYTTYLSTLPSFARSLRVLRCSVSAEIATSLPVASLSSTLLPFLEHLSITIVGKGPGGDFFFDLVAHRWELPELRSLYVVVPDEATFDPAGLLSHHGRRLENFYWDQAGANHLLPSYLLHLHRMPNLRSLATRPFSLGATRRIGNEETTSLAGVRDLVLINRTAEGVVADEFLAEVLSMRLFPSLERVFWDSGNGKSVAWKK